MSDSKEAFQDFTGYRFLLDAADTRQYALKIEEGQPKPPFDVYGVMPRDKSFRPNETVFAFDDEKTLTERDGRLLAQVTAYQINIGETGNPRKLFIAPVEYDIAAENEKAAQVTFTLTDESRARLKEEGFSKDFPAAFTHQINPKDFRHKPEGGAELRPGVLEALQVPPHQQGGIAFLARIATEQKMAQAIVRAVTPEQPAAAATDAAKAPDARDYSAPDAQTLVEKKSLGDGDTLKIIFNFESRRVTESVFNEKGVALTTHKFGDYDVDALNTAYQQLQKMGGNPRPLNDGKKIGPVPRPDNF